MTVRSDPLGGEDFVSNLQKNPETTGGEKSGIAPISGETYVDYLGKYTTKLKLFFPQATDDQIEALLYYKKQGMKKEFKKLYNKLYGKLYTSKPEVRKRQNEYKKQKYANDPEYRKRQKQKYVNDPEYRKRQIERQKQKYANDPEYRKRHKQKYANDPEYRKRKNERRKQKRLMKKLGTFNQFVQDKSISDQS